ncbi:MAG: hypothetical protein KC800_10565 [Candidatus Eremiobacteraeota bacterium]|nr:hypothetical protein [Candidatus Eremiobacteraeota bacterium]
MRVLVGRTLVLVLCLVGLAGSQPVNAPQEYRSNEGPVVGEADSPYQAGSLWVVLTEKLEGRSESDPSAPVVRVFSRGEVLQAEVGRGGSDEVLRNFVDEQGRAWMAVRVTGLPDYGCYVRANSHTIAPAHP